MERAGTSARRTVHPKCHHSNCQTALPSANGSSRSGQEVAYQPLRWQSNRELRTLQVKNRNNQWVPSFTTSPLFRVPVVHNSVSPDSSKCAACLMRTSFKASCPTLVALSTLSAWEHSVQPSRMNSSVIYLESFTNRICEFSFHFHL